MLRFHWIYCRTHTFCLCLVHFLVYHFFHAVYNIFLRTALFNKGDPGFTTHVKKSSANKTNILYNRNNGLVNYRTS